MSTFTQLLSFSDGRSIRSGETSSSGAYHNRTNTGVLRAGAWATFALRWLPLKGSEMTQRVDDLELEALTDILLEVLDAIRDAQKEKPSQARADSPHPLKIQEGTHAA